MPIDYDVIRKDNLREYGEGIGRWGGDIFANRYDTRTHFIFELIQNAEDALGKRDGWLGSRSVNFLLNSEGLTVSHYGKHFDEADVRGICGIAESTKELTDIGRFGIGFKSVYAFTNRPEIHSGSEHFAVESYVWPRAVEKKRLHPEQTEISIPFRNGELSAKEEILAGLRQLGFANATIPT